MRWNRLWHSCLHVSALLTQMQHRSLFTWRWGLKDHPCVCTDTARLIFLSTLINCATKICHTGRRIIHAVTQHLWWSWAKIRHIQSILNVLTNGFLWCAESTEVWQSNYISFTDELSSVILAPLLFNQTMWKKNILQSHFPSCWQTEFMAYNFLHLNAQMPITVLFFWNKKNKPLHI